MEAGDPRLSLEERYKNHDGYVAAVQKAAEKLEQQRLLPPADVQLAVSEPAPPRCAPVGIARFVREVWLKPTLRSCAEAYVVDGSVHGVRL